MTPLLCAALLYALGTATAAAADVPRVPLEHASAMPVRIESSSTRDEEEGRVQAHLDHPFPMVSEALHDAAAWCAIIGLHQNVKACVHDVENGVTHLKVYNGRKKYQDLDSTVITDYVWRRVAAGSEHLIISLTSVAGASRDGDYRIILDARADPAGGTAVDLRYYCRLSRLARAALRLYLATEGRDKTGFTVVGRDAKGRPQRVTGTRGLIERNSLRYYLAMVAFLDSRGIDEQAPLWRARRWYALTQRYAEQLHELERAEYLDNKRRELLRQSRLQAAVDAGERAESGH